MMTDPVSDMLTRIRNAQLSNKVDVIMPLSKTKMAIAKVLKDEGYINDYVSDNAEKPQLIVTLKYYEGKPVIENLKRISRPGLRIYKDKNTLPKVLNGLGIAIISTSSGMMTDKQAKESGFGGEVICTVS